MKDSPKEKPPLLEGADIICMASANWDAELWTNSQHIMSRLARNNRVLFVESLGLRTPTARWRDIHRVLGRLSSWAHGVKPVSENLHVYSPLVLPLYKLTWVRHLNYWHLRSSLNRHARKIGFKNPILWTFLPTSSGLVGHLGERLCIYHCVDEYGANPGVPAKVIHELERLLMSKADLVFTTSKGLYESKRPHNENTFYLPNVADYDHFHKATLEETVVPDDVSGLSGPVIGFIGAISGYKIDFELLRHIAETRPDWSIVLIGPVWPGDKREEIEALQAFPQVHFLGTRSYEDLPGYLKGFDVCMIPFALNDTTMNVFPMKFHEYIATGKPIVVVDLPSVYEYRKHCRMAIDKESFVVEIQKALEDEPRSREETLGVAKNNTWDARIEQISRIIRDSERGRGPMVRRTVRGRIGIDIRKIDDFGIGTYIRNLVTELGHIDSTREYVLFQAGDEPNVGSKNFTHVENRSPKYSVRELITLPIQMRRTRIDLFHSPHYVLPAIRPCRAVVTIHDLIHLFYPPSRAAAVYARAMMFAAARSAAKIITVSRSSRDDIVRNLGVPREKIVVIYNAVDRRFHPIAADDARVITAREFGLQGEYLLCVSNFLPHKNIENLLAAFRQVRDRGFGGKLVLAGSEMRERPEIVAAVERLRLGGSVSFPGFVSAEHLPALYSGCRAFVFPSLYEGFGLPPLEAMACGIPVVVSHTPAINEVVGKAGIHVDPESPAEIANGILRFLEDDDLHADYSQRGIERAARFSWRTAAERTLDVYLAVMDG